MVDVETILPSYSHHVALVFSNHTHFSFAFQPDFCEPLNTDVFTQTLHSFFVMLHFYFQILHVLIFN